MIFHLLNTGLHVDQCARRRLWVTPNQSVHLVSGVSFKIVQFVGGLLTTPYLEFSDAEGITQVPLAVQLRADLGLVFIPRSMELGARKVPMRFLMEIALAKADGNLPGLSINQR